MCITPITLKREYRTKDDSDQKNGSGLAHVVPCGKCVKCLRRRQASWAFRLMEQMKVSESACFLTFTYETAPVSPNGYMTLVKSDYQKFMKKLRKRLKPLDYGLRFKNHMPKLKYYAVGEYGSSGDRPHYHAIMFNLPGTYMANPDILTKVWDKGIIDIGTCTGASIAYTTKYIMSGAWEPVDIVDTNTGAIIEDDRQPHFSLMSKGLGSTYLTPAMVRYHKERLHSFITLPGGYLTALPRYFRDRIFTSVEKKEIATAMKEWHELNIENLFETAEAELTWKKDQIRKQEKAKLLERAKF